MTLTVKQIDAARFGIQKERMGDGGGLYLRLYPSGKKAFQVQVFKEQGQANRVWVSLGDYPDLGLREARDVAGWVRLQASRGWSAEQIRHALRAEELPVAAAPVAVRSMTAFRAVAKVWYDRKCLGLKNGKHIDQNWNTLVSYVFPKLGNRPIVEITRLDVVDALRSIWHVKNETARRTLGRVREIFELALLEYDVPYNPAVFDPKVAFGHVRRNTRHFGALPWEKVPELWVWLQTASCHEQTRQLVMLLALSAKRTSEARFARAEFLSSDGKVWTTPAELMKRAREHRVPMSRQAGFVWNNAKLISDDPALLFGKKANRSGVISENGALNLVKQFDAGITGHGFRSSFKGWARAQRRYAHDAIEFALAHRLPPLEEAYLREDLLEERAIMMQDWADFLCGGVNPLDLRARIGS